MHGRSWTSSPQEGSARSSGTATVPRPGVSNRARARHVFARPCAARSLWRAVVVKQGLTLFFLPAAMALQPLTYVLGLWLHDNWMAERINNGMFNSWQGSGPSPRRAGNSTVERIVWEPELPMSARKALIESLERGPLPPLA